MLNKTILIMENDLDLAEVLSDIFTLEGYTVIIWGHDYATATLPLTVDLVLCEMQLTSIYTGLHVLKNLRNDPQTHHIPFIMMSCTNDRLLRHRSHRLGADYYLNKPFRTEHLLDTVSTLITTIEPAIH